MYNEKPIIKLFKYENRFIQIAQIDDYESVSWERKLYEAGQFSITINFNIPNAHLFKRGMFVQLGNDPSSFGEIRKIQDTIGADGKGSQKRLITGYDARYIFKRRIISNLNNGDTWQLTGKAEIVMKSLIADQCGENAEEKRKLPINVENPITYMGVYDTGIMLSINGDEWREEALDFSSYGNYFYCRAFCVNNNEKSIGVFIDNNHSFYFWKSFDFGKSWIKTQIDISEPFSEYNITRSKIYRGGYSDKAKLYYAWGSATLNNDVIRFFLLKSSDGVNWTYTLMNGEGDLHPMDCVFAEDKNAFYICGYENINVNPKGMVIKTADFEHWETVYKTPNNVSMSNYVQFYGIAYSQKAKVFILTGISSRLSTWKSNYVISQTENQFDVNAGTIPTDTDDDLERVIYISEKDVFVTASMNTNKMFVSTDGGITWQIQFNQISNIKTLRYNNNLLQYSCYGYTGSSYKFFVSRDVINWEGFNLDYELKDYEIINFYKIIGKEVSVSESYSNLYEVLKTIAINGNIGWRVAFREGELFFEVYEGTDRSKSVFFNTEMDTLANGNFNDSLDNYVNAVYIGGKGEGSERDIYEGESLIEGESPSAFDRFESWSNESEMTNEEEYSAKAEGILNEAVKTLSFSGAGLAKSPYEYRKQYDVGDRISIAFSDIKATVQILSVTEHWQKGVYNMTFSFGKTEAELKNQLHTMLRQIQKASNKTSVIDCVKWYNVADVIAQSASDVTFNTLGFTGTSSRNIFKLCFYENGTGSKSYNIYVKNLTNDLTLTTGIEGASNLVLTAGTYVTRIYVDENGNVIKYNFS